jgi:branched-chain amino acid transport system permease protein
MMDGMDMGGMDHGHVWHLAVMMFLNGLSQASHMFLLALGLSLIFGVMRILNLAHGALHIFGVYAALTVLAYWSNWWVALLLGPLIVAGVGAVMETTLLRPMYRRHPTYVLILTFGAILVFYDLFRLGWGVEYQLLPEPGLVGGAIDLLGIVYPTFYLFSIVAAIAVGLLVWAFLERTRPGRLIRAAAEDREMAAAVGINVPLVYTAVFALGTLLTAFGGVLMGTIMATSPAEAFHTMLHAFAIVVIGGLGSLSGAALGAFLVGQVNAFGLLIAPEWEIAFMFLLMAIVLVLRPHGLLGRELQG